MTTAPDSEPTASDIQFPTRRTGAQVFVRHTLASWSVHLVMPDGYTVVMEEPTERRAIARAWRVSDLTDNRFPLVIERLRRILAPRSGTCGGQ